MTIPIERLPRYIHQLKDNLKSLVKHQKQLQRLEPQIKQYFTSINSVQAIAQHRCYIDFTTIYSNIRESYRQCENDVA